LISSSDLTGLRNDPAIGYADSYVKLSPEENA
jgi:hypothetical protein